MISFNEVRQFFHYNPDTGVMRRTHKTDRWGNVYPYNSEPLSLTNGYRTANFKGDVYKIHRLIWLYVTGEWPAHDIDHINGDRLDNRLCNLRSVPRSENTKNRGINSNNETGCPGIHWEKNVGKYRVRISVNGVRQCLGFYTDLNDAIEVKKKAEIEHGFHENHGERPSWRK